MIDNESDRQSGTMSHLCDAVDSRDTTPVCRSQPRQGTLTLLQLVDWDKDKAYDEQPPTCIHYSIEWKLTVNSKQIAKQTEPNLVLAPNAYWTKFLQSKLKRILSRKFPNKAIRPDDTAIVVFVTDRTVTNLRVMWTPGQ